ncbi:MAG: hypothetical protein IKB99_07950, partial [Lentisphaeria bacterium]|nr:hypothetical protein [Lentisphaeria bacterium]
TLPGGKQKKHHFSPVISFFLPAENKIYGFADQGKNQYSQHDTKDFSRQPFPILFPQLKTVPEHLSRFCHTKGGISKTVQQSRNQQSCQCGCKYFIFKA